MLSRFAWMKKERETLDYLLKQGSKGGPRLRDRWRFLPQCPQLGYRTSHARGLQTDGKPFAMGGRPMNFFLFLDSTHILPL